MLWRWLLNAKSKFDYSQLELRVGAYVAEEPVLKKIFQDNGDVHAYTQAKIQRVLNSAKITPDIHRRIAKTLNFGVFYGGTGYTLMSRLLKEGIQLPLYVCDGLAQTIGKAFSRIEDYRQDVWLEIINKGYVGVATGRHINYYMAGAVKSKQEAILREGANAKIQGLASDICLSAVVDLWERYGLLPTIYRHDEAVYDVTYEELSAYQKELENPPVLTQYGLEIPLRVDLTNLTVAGARKK
jgi:DNA polymerase-1